MMQRVFRNRGACAGLTGAVAGIVACVIGISGCGHKTVASTSGTVSGTVTCKGAPLTSGMVYLAPAADTPAWSGGIDDKGGYSLRYVAAGTYKVWLSEATSIAGLPSDPAFKSIPKEYLSATTTPLSVTVKVGQTIDFPIAIGQ